MTDALKSLTPRELAFVAAYAKLQAEAVNPCDEDLAVALNVCRKTIINRRNRIRAKGVPLFRFRDPGFDDRRKALTLDQMNRKALRLRRRAEHCLKRADRLEEQAREMAAATAG